ncbi:MAG: nucleotidyltransferase family protein [Actinobacteria bacterium]|nr:MAG: nucleotidyltransferase family protein [Actinomycetota bacterium]
MKAVILAGGYATRLYPLTRDRPKHLLEVDGRPLLELLLERLPLGELDAVYVVTNAKFAERFREWAESYPTDVIVLDDGTTSEEDRLGAIGDLQLVIESEGIDDDLIVAAGDSIFTERLDDFARFGRERDAAAIAVYDVGNLEAMKQLSSIGVDADSRLVTFEEKPERPESTLAGIALYFYPRAIVPLVGEYLAEGNNPDQPGRLIGWLYERTPVYAWRVPGRWFDIGTPETLAQAERLFEKD